MTHGLDHIQKTKDLAHAYLVRGDAHTIQIRLIEVLEGRGIATKGDPDFYAATFESLAVDDVRAIADYASLAPLSGRKYIVLAAGSATPEAQTALLKIVEEGTGRSVFFIIVPAGAAVLPTLESRCVVLKIQDESNNTKEGKEFLGLSYADRLAVAEKFAKNHDREGARALVRSLLALAAEPRGDISRFEVLPQVLRDLLDADRYLALSGSSPKSVIGHLALTLP